MRLAYVKAPITQTQAKEEKKKKKTGAQIGWAMSRHGILQLDLITSILVNGISILISDLCLGLARTCTGEVDNITTFLIAKLRCFFLIC